MRPRHPFGIPYLSALLTFWSILGLATFPNTAHATSGEGNPALQFEGRISYRAFRANLKASMSEAEWKAFKRQALTLVPMRERWKGEDQPGFKKNGHSRRQVDYLKTEDARTPFKISIGTDGRLYSQGARFDTAGELVGAVAGPDNAIYADTSNTKPNGLNLKHSSFLDGQSAFAFEINSKDGLPQHATNRSGHYRLPRLDFAMGLLNLEAQKIDMSELEISFDEKSK